MERIDGLSRRNLLKRGALALASARLARFAKAQNVTASGPYVPTWDSLKQWRMPEWFRDAKFGIWAHWSAQCVPEAGDWYARNMYGQGQPQYEHHLKRYGHPADTGFMEMENRWKATQASPEQVAPVRYEEGAPPQAAPQQGEPGRIVTAVVQFAGLKEWQQIRGRLAQVPGLQGLEVNSLSARTASITFDYAGSLGRLQKVLADSGFSFENGEENFVLRVR